MFLYTFDSLYTVNVLFYKEDILIAFSKTKCNKKWKFRFS